MSLMKLFLDPRTGLLRSGWRAAIFIALLYSPYLILRSFLKPAATQAASIDVSLPMILTYGLLVLWVMAVSWLCLKFLEGMKLSSLGFALRSGWFSDVLKGFVMAALMITLVVMLQIIGRGSQSGFNPVWFHGQEIYWAGAWIVLSEAGAAIVLLALAAAFEELGFRGYAFQTLLRGAPAIVPILIFSIYFGWAHWDNPNRTFFSTANTALAGVWLSIAYLKTRSLWFPAALHGAWNWMMGAFFGIPVSGLRIPENSILVTTSGEPVWLTGGSYGSEGGVAATVVLVIAIVVIWRARWLGVSPDMNAALQERFRNEEEAISLGLRGDSGQEPD